MLRAAIGLGWASPEHLDEVEVPVDVHDVRISLQTGILHVAEEQKHKFVADTYSALAPAVRRILTQICADEKVSWLNIDRALWLIGSRGCVRRRCFDCPLSSVCSASDLRLV